MNFCGVDIQACNIEGSLKSIGCQDQSQSLGTVGTATISFAGMGYKIVERGNKQKRSQLNTSFSSFTAGQITLSSTGGYYDLNCDADKTSQYIHIPPALTFLFPLTQHNIFFDEPTDM